MARAYRRKRYYSTPQRILVHLSSDETLQPAALSTRTQEGIAESTLCGRTTVTKWLTRLEREAVLVGARAHVPGHTVRKTVFELTQVGWGRARELRRRLVSEVVEVIAPRLAPVLMDVSDIPETFPGLGNLTLTVSLVSEGRIDLRRHTARVAGSTSSLMWGEDMPRSERIFGRESEAAFMSRWLASRFPILAVTGLPGIGKSTVVASWIQQRTPRIHAFWCQLRPSVTPYSFLADLTAFLARLGRRATMSYLSEGGRLNLEMLRQMLAHDIGTLPMLIVLDGFERAQPETARFLRQTLLRLGPHSRLKMVVISRSQPRFDSRAGAMRRLLEVLRVKGLDEDASIELLRHKGWTGTHEAARKIALSSRGHPLLLHLVAQSGTILSENLEHYFEEDIWSALTPSERIGLEAAVVFREPVPMRVLQSFPGVTGSAIWSLRTKNLLEPTQTGRLAVHDLIRDQVLRRLHRDRVRALHEQAASELLRSNKPRERFEGFYHLLRAGRTKETADTLDAEGPRLLDSVSIPEVALLLRGIDLEVVDLSSACVFSELQGDSLRILGHIGPALMQYAHAIRRCEAAARQERVPRILRKIASIERMRNRHPKALGYLVEARARLSRLPDSPESAEVLREMALVEQAGGNLKLAAAYLDEAIDRATEAADYGALARDFLALGTLEAQRGQMERSLAYKLEGLRFAERAANLTEVARSCIGVGAAHAEMGQLRKSLRYYERALQLTRLLGNCRLTSYAIMNRCAALIDLGRYQEAAGSLREARDLAEILGERENLDILWIYEGNLERGLGHWTRARGLWERGLNALRDHGHPHDLVRALQEIGTFHIEHGDVELGLAYLDEAAAIARRLGNLPLLKAVQVQVSRVGAKDRHPLPAASRESP